MSDVDLEKLVVDYNDEDVRKDAKEKRFADGAIVCVKLSRGKKDMQEPKLKKDKEGKEFQGGGHLRIKYQVQVLNPENEAKIVSGTPYLSTAFWMPLRNPAIEGHVVEDWVKNFFTQFYMAFDPDNYPAIVGTEATGFQVLDESYSTHEEAKMAQSQARLVDAVKIWSGEWKRYNNAIAYGTISQGPQFANINQLRSELKPGEELTPLSKLIVDA